MEGEGQRQGQTAGVGPPRVGRRDLITPNPKLKLLDQVREVLRLKHYSLSS
jgi:hypothetical protein